MKRSALASSLATCLCLGLAAPLLAAPSPMTGTKGQPSAGEKSASAIKPAEKCISDLQAFHSQMGKDGYWLGGSGYGYGYGYPMAGYSATAAATITTGYQNVRPGYEVRTLLASANILAQLGRQQPCEDVLATTRTIYKRYVADMKRGGIPAADVPGWRQHQITAAQPVTTKNTSFRSDELIGAEVLSPKDEVLGSVDDLVMSPKTGGIAYLVISRGGVFGIDKRYVPVPWDAFKVSPNVNLLVLGTSKSNMDSVPQVNNNQFAIPSHFDQESQKVDAYWKTHLTSKSPNGSNG